ncbi:MAG: 3-phosphoserine/phosphohydroxythreonine transaminase [Gammaproteobacteria bacterium]
MARVYNFGAGPAALPEEVLLQAQEEMLDWQSLGMSVMEVSHRGQNFKDLLQRAEQDLRDLLAIPDDYRVLFLTGPARSQFAMIPSNLLGEKTTADYIDTGMWSHAAIAEGQHFCQVNVAASSESKCYKTIPSQDEWQLNSEAAYCYYTTNETVGGVEFHAIPQVGEVPLVADMTSTLLSRPLDISKFGLIYAGAQKNFGPAGLTVVIVRDDLLDKAVRTTPSVFNYALQAKSQSLYCTPATFACYISGLVFRWIKQQGGLDAMATLNARKSTKLYEFIDNHDFYQNDIDPNYRSWMNIPFTLADEGLNEVFLEEAQVQDLYALKGHRSVGGMRASIYNGMPEAGVDILISFMDEFASRHG